MSPGWSRDRDRPTGPCASWLPPGRPLASFPLKFNGLFPGSLRPARLMAFARSTLPVPSLFLRAQPKTLSGTVAIRLWILGF